jgi:hypothetical protein
MPTKEEIPALVQDLKQRPGMTDCGRVEKK